jgi:transcriptional regulator with XRE-family HTH domain
MKCPNCGKEMKFKFPRLCVHGVRAQEHGAEGYHCSRMQTLRRGLAGNTKHQADSPVDGEYLLKKQGAITGLEFRYLRKAMGKSAKETAECLAVNPVTISRWENNKEKIGPQSDRLLRMAFILDPAEARSFAATKLLEFARATLACTIAPRKRAKPEKIVITPSDARQGE